MFLQMPAVRRCRAKTAFLLPLAGALMLAFPGISAGPSLAGGKPVFSGLVVPLKMPLPLQDTIYDVGAYNDPKRWPWDYKAFLKRNPQVEKLIWHWNQKLLVLRPAQAIVILKSGDQEIYRYSNASEMAAARKKYGRFPWAAPPVAKYDFPLQIPERKPKPEGK
jgi:hypothetical protein